MRTLKNIVHTVLFLAAAAMAVAQEGMPTDSMMGVKLGMSMKDAKVVLNKLGPGGINKTHEGTYKGAWRLNKGDYSAVVFEAGKDGKVEWLSFFVRPGSNILFSDLADPNLAVKKSARHIVWLTRGKEGRYTLFAKGGENKASTVSLRKLTEDEKYDID